MARGISGAQPGGVAATACVRLEEEGGRASGGGLAALYRRPLSVFCCFMAAKPQAELGGQAGENAGIVNGVSSIIRCVGW